MLPISFFTSIVARSNTSSSNCWWASIRMVPPGVSYTPLDFIPTTRFSTISTIPIPCLPPSSFNLRITSETFMDTPFTLVGIPFSKAMVTYSPSSGASSGVTPNTSICLKLGSLEGSSSSRPSWLICHKFRSRL